MAITFHPFRPQRDRSGRRQSASRSRRRSTSVRQSARRSGQRAEHQAEHPFEHPFEHPSERLPSRNASKRPGKRKGQRLSAAADRHLRPLMVWSILMVGLVGLMFNLFRLQVLQGSILQERAKAQQTISVEAGIPRRPILDREGNVLAIDKPVYTLYAHPILFGNQQKETVAVALVPVLNQPLEKILAELNSSESGIRLADALSESVANQVRQLGLDGLELVQQQERLYPQQDLFANIVGYVNFERQGQAGVEYSQEEQLARHLDAMQISRSGDGSIIPLGLPDDFLRRDELQLQLSLDMRLQRASRHSLRQQMRKYSAKRGVVIVMDVQNGSILAMAADPTYDPNKFYQTDLEKLRDWVLTDLYEPGSTFKPINLAIALETGMVKPNDVFIDEGAIQIGEWPIQNSDYDAVGGRGPLSVTEILQYSSNVGMVHIMQRLKAGVYYGWLERLKLDQPTGIDLPSEAPGQIKTYEQFTGALVEPATTAFGQGFSLTPIKMAQLHSMIANGGKLVTPHVVKGLVDEEGKLKWQPEPSPPKQIFSPKNTEAVLKMMEQVVTEGTGKVAQIPGYRIGGKTGTAQKASPNGGYSSARITSFVGILPVEAPRYVVLAVVDEPQGDDAYGSTVAAPIVKEVMKALIASERLAPSKPEELEADEEEISQAEPLSEPIDFYPEITEYVEPTIEPDPEAVAWDQIE